MKKEGMTRSTNQEVTNQATKEEGTVRKEGAIKVMGGTDKEGATQTEDTEKARYSHI